jgi:hypothetical protein
VNYLGAIESQDTSGGRSNGSRGGTFGRENRVSFGSDLTPRMSTSAKTASFWSPEGGPRDQQDQPVPPAPLHGEDRTLTVLAALREFRWFRRRGAFPQRPPSDGGAASRQKWADSRLARSPLGEWGGTSLQPFLTMQEENTSVLSVLYSCRPHYHGSNRRRRVSPSYSPGCVSMWRRSSARDDPMRASAAVWTDFGGRQGCRERAIFGHVARWVTALRVASRVQWR